MKFPIALLALFAASAEAYSPSPIGRREVFQSIVSAGAAAVVASPSVANALGACSVKSHCIRTDWTPPPGTSKDTIIATLKKTLDAYPQAGQQSVDLGGWTVVDDLSDGYGRVEFKSGIGNFAKFLNGGKPFVDDLDFEIADTGVVAVKSSSRVGDSDFGVNQKRLNFFAAKLREEGWNVPDPTY